MARLGLLVPSVNTVVEPEFWRMAPADVTLHAARMRNARCDVDDSIRMLDHVGRAADELGSARVDAIAFCCTASSFVQGTDGEHRLTAAIERAGGTTAVTTSAAVVAALRALGALRLAMYTPYPAELNRREVAFLEQQGFQVAHDAGLDIADAVTIADVTGARLRALIAGAPPPADVDALFLSCTNMPTLDVIEGLEREFDLPVISSNAATLWQSLRRLDHTAAAAGPGRLFQMAAVASRA